MSDFCSPIVWSIAGSDNTAGAGIQADNQSFRSFGVQSGNIITAVTAQNHVGVQAIQLIDADNLENQWESLILSLPPQVIKLGMIGSQWGIDWLIQKLNKFEGLVVCDPVLVATNGGTLMTASAQYKLLFPWVDLITPNYVEFDSLFGDEIQGLSYEKSLPLLCKKYDIAILLTGGDHQTQQAQDILCIKDTLTVLSSPKINSRHTHGTGCSLSAAIAASLGLGYSLIDAVILAKSYMNQGFNQQDIADYSPAGFQHTHFPNAVQSLPVIQDDPSLEAFPKLQYPLGFYPLVDNLKLLKTAIDAGVKTIQLRIKNTPLDVVRSQILTAKTYCESHDVQLFINDYWDIAIELGCYGVHLGQEDFTPANLARIQVAGLRLGISCHNLYEITFATQLKPSYIALGPVFATQSKAITYHTLGLNHLQPFVELLQDDYPLTCIGGITEQNIPAVLATGIRSIALIGAIKHHHNPLKQCHHFIGMINA